MTPAPSFTRPEKLTRAPSTFIVVLFQDTYTPTVRDAVRVVLAPVAMPLWLSVPTDVTKHVPLPVAVSSQTGMARTKAVPVVNVAVADSALVGSVSRFAFVLPFNGAAFTTQH